MELRDRGLPGLSAPLRAALLAALCATLIVPASAAAAELDRPASQTEPPRFFERSARQVIAIASRAGKVRAERRDGRLEPTAYVKRPGRWQVSFYRDGDETVQVLVDDSSGAILEQWSGHQVAWTMARGYDGAFGRKLNAPWVWLSLSALFLVPFLDLRRPFRLLHMDLVVLLAFGVSHVFFNRGEIGVSVPLVYPVLLYLLVRVLLAAMRPRRRVGRLVPHMPVAWLAIGLVLLLAFRICLNVIDSNVIDVGYAGVIGADRIVDGDELYGEGFSADVERGDTYGPANYLLYVPSEQLLPWSGRWDDLPAAHGVAIAADLLVMAGLLLLGPRLRPGREGRVLGLALAYAWAAYPYSAFVLETNANDSLVALACVGALLSLTLRPERLSACGSALAVGLGTALKFAPLALAPLFARRGPTVFLLLLGASLVAVFAPLIPDGGVGELYDRTLGYQAGRPSPFSVWGQEPSLGWLQTAVKAVALGLALLAAIVPRRPDARQVAALGAALLILVQLATTHWFYLYVVWFTPFVLVASLGAYRWPRRPVAASWVHTREREVVPG